MNKYIYELTYRFEKDHLVYQAIGGEVNGLSRLAFVKYYFEKLLAKGFNLKIEKCEVVTVAIGPNKFICWAEVTTPHHYDAIDIAIDMDNDLVSPYFSKVERFVNDQKLVLISDREEFDLPYYMA